MIIFGSILTTFEVSCNFEAVAKIGSKSKIKPSNQFKLDTEFPKLPEVYESTKMA